MYLENFWAKSKFNQNPTRVTSNLHEYICTVLIVAVFSLLIMVNVSHKSCTENQNTHFVFGNFFSKIVPFMR